MAPDRSDEQWLKRFELEEFPQPECILLRHPVFICHGYGAVASLMKPSPLHDVCMFMRSRGIPAVAPNIVPYATIETRAEDWASLITRFADRLGVQKVNVIAHSQGGLDMRYALARTGIKDRVCSLTTIATPHHGTSLALLGLNTPHSIRDRFVQFFNWMGEKVYPSASSDVMGSIQQLTPDYITTKFNSEIRDVHEVRYFSISAAVGKGTAHPIAPMMRFQNQYIYDREGVNDGFVSRESAKWGEHWETITLSHVEQININLSDKRTELWEQFYERLLHRLADEGL
ncbi:MAG: esterase/lipase family protein [Bacteroidota bacterium]